MSHDFLQKMYINHPNSWVITLVLPVSEHFDPNFVSHLSQTLTLAADLDWEILHQAVIQPTDATNNLPQHSQTSPVMLVRWVVNLGTPSVDRETIREIIQAHVQQSLLQLEIAQLATAQLKHPVELEKADKFDINMIPLATLCRPHKLALFDMDSTLIEQEVIVELAKKAGIGEQVNAITESAMRGEIDFSESFTRRVGLLNGLDSRVLDEIIRDAITFSLGAKRLITTLKNHGYHVVLVSGGFTYFAEFVKSELGIDEIYANDLDIVAGKLTGKITSPIVDGAKKAEILQAVAQRLNIGLNQTIAVGDGANDLPMLGLADIGIAYRAKPIVQAQADYVVNVAGLDGVLAILGLE